MQAQLVPGKIDAVDECDYRNDENDHATPREARIAAEN
jgi:hypothetical protein